MLDKYIKTLQDSLSTIEDFDSDICIDMSDSELTEVVASSRAYHMTINQKLSGYKAIRESLMANKSPNPSSSAIPGKIVKLPLPPIQIQTFENDSENPFSYYTFKKSFKNAIAGMPNLTGAQKLIYLTPKRRAKGKFHYPTAGLFSASLKMKIKIFFLLEIVRNDVKKHKMQLFPFRFHLT